MFGVVVAQPNDRGYPDVWGAGWERRELDVEMGDWDWSIKASGNPHSRQQLLHGVLTNLNGTRCKE